MKVDWRLIALWESSSAPETSASYSAREPSASQLMELARILNAHPLDFFQSYENALASEKEEERASRTSSGICLDGRQLAIMRKVRGLSYPQAATRAKVSLDEVRRAEEGRTINTGALLRLLQAYEPRRAPVEVMATVVVRSPHKKRRSR